MLKRPPDGAYLEDDIADAGADEVRRGDVLMEPGSWMKDAGMYRRFPRQGPIPICVNGNLVGKVAAGANVAVNCRDVSKSVGAVLAGYQRKRDVFDPRLVRPGVSVALARLKAHIDAALETFLASNALDDFFSGDIGTRIILPEDKFQGIGLDNLYSDFTRLDYFYQCFSNPDEYDTVSVQQYLDSPRVKWLMDLKVRLEEYVRQYVQAHVSVNSCYSHQFGTEVSFNVIYLPKMVTTWDYDAGFGGGNGLKLKAYFLHSDTRDFILRGLKFKV